MHSKLQSEMGENNIETLKFWSTQTLKHLNFIANLYQGFLHNALVATTENKIILKMNWVWVRKEEDQEFTKEQPEIHHELKALEITHAWVL